jgi:hypothetical protein
MARTANRIPVKVARVIQSYLLLCKRTRAVVHDILECGTRSYRRAILEFETR